MELTPTYSLCNPHVTAGGFLAVSILFIFSMFGVQCDWLQASTSLIYYIWHPWLCQRVSLCLPLVVTSVMKTHSILLVVWCLVVFYTLFHLLPRRWHISCCMCTTSCTFSRISTNTVVDYWAASRLVFNLRFANACFTPWSTLVVGNLPDSLVLSFAIDCCA